MTIIDLHIFKKDTDAIFTNRGFLFQYVVTLNVWLQNYIEYNGKIIYCEVEDDIKQFDSSSSTINYTQIKCYSDSLSLNDEEIQKAIYNFFNLFLQYKTFENVSFVFISSTRPGPKDLLLNNWIKEKNNLGVELLDQCMQYVKGILHSFFNYDYTTLIK